MNASSRPLLRNGVSGGVRERPFRGALREAKPVDDGYDLNSEWKQTSRLFTRRQAAVMIVAAREGVALSLREGCTTTMFNNEE